MGGHGRAVIERLAAVHLLRPCRRSARRCGGGCGTGHARTTNGSKRGRSTGDAEPGARAIGEAGFDVFRCFRGRSFQGRCGGGACRAGNTAEAGGNTGSA